MNVKRLVAFFSAFISTITVSSANAQSVFWTRINSLPPTAQKIAACPNGAMYVLHSGNRVLGNQTSGRGADWQRINVAIPGDPNPVTSILCAGNKRKLGYSKCQINPDVRN